ncbi:MAG TPA: CcmD family protein [Chloroflexota bacterium]|nr:CcmD family protein [Chloroflexota bacterium]
MPAQNLIYLFSAYTIIWIVLFGYMVFLHGQLGDLKSQLAALRKRREAIESEPRPQESRS